MQNLTSVSLDCRPFLLSLFLVLPVHAQEEEPPAEAQTQAESSVRFDPIRGILVEPDGQPFTLRFGGRAHLDTGYYNSNREGSESRLFFRRARPYVSGTFYEDWSFKVEYDFGDVDGWRNVRLRYGGIENVRFTAGNQIVPFGLENTSSSNYLTFMERSLASSLAPLYHSGVEFDAAGEHSTVSAGIYGHPMDGNDRNGVQGVSFAARSTWAPIRKRRETLHFGVSFEYKDVDRGDPYRIATRAESRLGDSSILSTGRLFDVDSTSTLGLESAWVDGPWSLQGEWIFKDLDRTARDAQFTGWYVEGSWFPTGENRRYGRRSATFGSVRPRSDYGAVQYALRFSSLNLRDAGILGGDAWELTAGVNYHIRRNVRLAMNYAYANASPNSSGEDEAVNLIQFRTYVFF